MKKILLLFALVLFSVGNLLNAQSTYVVANGTATNSYLPVYGTWMDANQHDQFIYPVSEVGPISGGTISKITFHSSTSTTNSAWGTATCVIKFGVPLESNYASASYNTTTLTQVYSGPISVVNGIMEFTLTTPFTFPGGNLLIDITTTTSGSYSSVTFSGITATNGGMYQYSTNSPVLQQFLPKMTVNYTGGSPTVITSAASDIFATSATLNGAFYNLTPLSAGFQYMEASLTDWTSATTVNETTLTTPISEIATSLSPTTQYKFRAFAVDSATATTFYGGEVTFTTLSLPAQLPYACDFENPTENAQWTMINGTQTNQFYIGDASLNPAINNTLGGYNALYISNDGSYTWAYSGTGSTTNSWVYAYRDFEVPAGVNELKLDFDWIANGGVAKSEFLRVYWMPVSIPVTAGNLPPTINSINYDLAAQIGNYTNGYGEHWLSKQTTWQHAQFTINSTQYPNLAGTTWRLYVHWRNNQTSAVQPPATFDNMTLVVSNCPVPRIDSVTNATASSLDVYFTEMGTATSWNIQYKPLASSTWTTIQTTTNPTTIPGLNGSTSYQFQIQADCGTEQSAYSPIIKKNTACGNITQFPWGEGFEYPTSWSAAVAPGNATAQTCWLNINGASSSGYWQRTSTASYIRSGAGAAQQYSGGTTVANSDYLITPPISLTGNQRLRFWAKGYSTYVEKFKVAIYDITTNGHDVQAATDTTLFVDILPTTTANNNNWVEYEIYLNQYVGDYRIAFIRNTTQGYYLNLDDISISEMPTCIRPTNVSSSNVTAYDATIQWTSVDPNASAWFIYYKPVAATTWDSVQVYTTPHLLDNLIPSTNYQFYMKTNCGSELSEATSIYTFTTLCIPVTTLPWNDGFESITAANQLPACWTSTNLGTYTYTQITNYNSYNRNARTGTCAAYFRYGCNDRFFTPGFQLTAGVAYQFTYWYVTDGLGGWTTLQSGAYSAQNAGSLVQTMNTISSPTNGTYQEVVSYFTPTTDGIYYFGIYCNSTTSPWYLTIDDINVDLAPNCLPVQSLAVSNIAGTSAFVSWIPNGTPDYFTVALSPAGQGTWTTYTTTNSNYILSGLTELTAYDVQVYPSCSGVDGPADTVSFTTICAAGGNLFIGTPNATTSSYGNYLPSYLCYNYSYTQQIFDAAEVTTDTISNIAFQYFYTSSDTRKLKIFMGHTTQSTFTGISNYIPFDSLTQVYQGSILFNNSGINNWVNITLNTPFAFDGVRNLVIAVQDTTGTYTVCAETFRTHSTTGNKALYFYQDASIINPVSPSASSSGVANSRNNIRITLPCETVSCYQPNVIINNVTSSSAEFFIVPGGSETSWEAEYKTAAATSWTSLGTVTASPYALPGLNSNTTYQVRFRSVCSASDMSTWKMVSFTTLCGNIVQLPFLETFDTYGQGTNIYPTCWVRTSTAGTYPYITTSYPISTPYSMYFYSSSTTQSTIVLPKVDPSIAMNTLQLTFWERVSTAGNGLQVGIMTNPYDASTFTLIGTANPATLNAYEELSVSFANYTDTGRYVAIRSDLSAFSLSNNAYIDNLTLGLIPTCVKPTNILFTNIMQTTATGYWTPSTSAVSYEVVYGLPGIDPLTATPVPVTDTFVNMINLTANTLYHFYVRSVCAGGEYSDWTFVRTFRTACDAISVLPWTDNFDSYGTGTTIFPACWTRNTTYADRPYVSSTNFSAPGSLYFYAGTAGTYNIAATPMFASSIPINTLKANFKYRNTYATDTMFVGVMTDPLNASTFVQVAAVGASATGTWQDKEVFFNNYTGTGQYIAFKIQYNSTYMYGYIDNLEIMDIPTCPRPTLATVSNITSSSMDLDWTETGTATQWEVEYGPAGFTHGNGTFVLTSTHPVNIPSLTPSTSYDFYIRAICSAGDTSYWSNKVVGVTACVPITTLPWNEGFESITVANELPVCWSATNLGTYTFTQIADYGSYNRNARTGTKAAYFKWGCNDRFFTPGFQLSAGVAYQFSYWYVTDAYTGWNTLELGAYSGQTAGTLVQTLNTVTAPVNTTYVQVNATFTPTTTGTYYFGIYCSSNSVPYYLTFDDLSLTASAVTCPIPTNLAVSGITSSGATATWTAGGTETQWEIAYKPTASSTWLTSIVNTTPTYPLTGLTSGTPYDVKVRAICAAGDSSVYTAIVNFTTTTVSCPTPTNVVASNITNTGATITWTAGGTETAWEVDYKLAAATTWTTVNATSTTQNINGLITCSDYNVRVRAVCGVGIYSNYTTVVNFSTPTPAPTNVQVIPASITDQGATVTWTAGGTETQWIVEYKLASSTNWTTSNVLTATTFPIGGLQSNSTYDVRVKAICGTHESAFTTPVQFTTTGAVVYTITATATGPGTITPSGAVVVNAGANQEFTFTPNTGAVIASLNVDNLPVTIANTYMFTTVVANHTITVDFAPDAINENDLAKLVALYPNPTNSYIELSINETQLQVKECKVFDIYGKLLKVVPVSNDHTRIDVSDFAAGVYMIRIDSEMGTITKKFVKE